MTNQTIKFRAKNASGLWLYGNLIDCGNFKSVVDAAEISKRPLEYVGHLISTSPVQEDTIGQFTGLKDKNGKEIYEGDIVHTQSWYNAGFNTFDYDERDIFHVDDLKGIQMENSICSVTFEEGCFMVGNTELCAFFGNMKHIQPIREIEVIGNIYDNKKLLED